MKIVSWDVERIQGAMSAFSNANHVWEERASLLLTAHLEGGAQGVGEASPLPGYSPDSLEQAYECLRSLPEMHEINAGQIEDFARDSASGAPSARFAIETALYRALGQSMHQSWSALLAGACSSYVVSHLIGSFEQARAAYLGGARHVKIKVGRALDEECGLVTRCRRELPTLTVRVDANRSLRPDDVKRFSDLGIEYIEEPVALENLRTLQSPLPPIALDETLRDPEGKEVAQELHAKGLLAALVLKPTVLGGIHEVYSWANIAHEMGVDVVLSHCLGGPTELEVCRVLAERLSRGNRAQGVADHPGLEAFRKS